MVETRGPRMFGRFNPQDNFHYISIWDRGINNNHILLRAYLKNSELRLVRMLEVSYLTVIHNGVAYEYFLNRHPAIPCDRLVIVDSRVVQGPFTDWGAEATYLYIPKTRRIKTARWGLFYLFKYPPFFQPMGGGV